MSFTPTIVYDWNDLNKHYEKIETEYWQHDQERNKQKPENRVLTTSEVRQHCIEILVEKLHNPEPQVEFKGVKFSLMSVEFTTSNRVMRSILDELGVPYSLLD